MAAISVVSWIINNECQLECVHCYAGSGPGAETRPRFAARDIEQMCESIASASPRRIFLSGGEPTLLPDLPVYLRNTRRIAADQLWVCSNGLSLTDAHLAVAVQEGVDGFSLSVQHTSATQDDRYRQGKNLLPRSLQSIQRIQKRGLRVALDMTVSRWNVEVIEDFIELGHDLGVNLVMFKRFRPIGRGQVNQQELELTPAENQQALQRILAKACQLPNLTIKVDDPLYWVEITQQLERSAISKDQLPPYLRQGLEDASRFPSALRGVCGEPAAVQDAADEDSPGPNGERPPRHVGCMAGVQWVGIDPDGNVSPCPLLMKTGVVIGNIRQKPLAQIIDESPEMTFLRNAHLHSSCSYFGVCGGCRAHSSATLRRFLAKDPMCWHNETCFDDEHQEFGNDAAGTLIPVEALLSTFRTRP